MNKKRWIITAAIAVVVVAVIVVCFLCCGRKNHSYCSVVPKDAKALARVDVTGFMKKHHIDLEDVLGAGELFIQNSGIDVELPFYVFVTPKEATGVVLPVKDSGKLKTMLSTYGEMLNIKLSEKQGYNWMEMGDAIGCFDNTRMLILMGGGMNARKILLTLMEQNEEESIMGTTLYSNVEKLDKPLAMVLPLEESLTKGKTLVGNGVDIKPECLDADVAVTFDIQGSEAIFAIDLVLNTEEMKNYIYIAEHEDKLKKIDGTFVAQGMSHPLVWGSLSFDGSKITPEMLESIKAIKELADIAGLDKALTSLRGDISFSYGDDKVLVQANVADNHLLALADNVKALTGGQLEATKLTNNTYCIGKGDEPIFIGQKDNTFYVSNSGEMNALVGKKAESSLVSKLGDIKECYFYVSCDVQQLLAVMQKADPNMKSSLLLMGSRLKELDQLTLRCPELTHAELVLSVKDGADFVEKMFK
ncbi:MAG: DUF4836 family protein [Bacteroidales bacterium]|nr:DUF4836 family protein [Candidatus Physcousia equi]